MQLKPKFQPANGLMPTLFSQYSRKDALIVKCCCNLHHWVTLSEKFKVTISVCDVLRYTFNYEKLLTPQPDYTNNKIYFEYSEPIIIYKTFKNTTLFLTIYLCEAGFSSYTSTKIIHCNRNADYRNICANPAKHYYRDLQKCKTMTPLSQNCLFRKIMIFIKICLC